MHEFLKTVHPLPRTVFGLAKIVHPLAATVFGFHGTVTVWPESFTVFTKPCTILPFSHTVLTLPHSLGASASAEAAIHGAEMALPNVDLTPANAATLPPGLVSLAA